MISQAILTLLFVQFKSSSSLWLLDLEDTFIGTRWGDGGREAQVGAVAFPSPGEEPYWTLWQEDVHGWDYQAQVRGRMQPQDQDLWGSAILLVQQGMHMSRTPVSSPLKTVTTQAGLRSNVDAESRVHLKNSYGWNPKHQDKEITENHVKTKQTKFLLILGSIHPPCRHIALHGKSGDKGPKSIITLSLLLEGKTRPRWDTQTQRPCIHDEEVLLLFHIY